MSRFFFSGPLAWLGSVWIAFEFFWYEQYKLVGPTLVFERLSDWSGIPEPLFRLFVAGMEITAGVLVLIPVTQGFGALFSMGIMAGAIVFHLFTPLGVDPYGDGGNLFKEACFTFVVALCVAFLRRDQLIALAKVVFTRLGLRPIWTV
jgi:uncharacterized membrane protein YphA (DoxX/SURF4 family)